MKKYVLCIDRGTTAIKAVLFDFQGKELEKASQPCQEIQKPFPGWCEQDLLQIWTDTVMAIRNLLEKGICPEEIAAIGVSGMGNGLNLLDGNGRPTRACITSLDSRATQITDEWRKGRRIEELLACTGSTFIVPCTPMPILRWVRLNEPEVYERSEYVIFSKDWVRYCLTGVISTDYTDTSGALLVNLDTREYMEELFVELGIEKLSSMLPKPQNSYDIGGYVTAAAAAETGLVAGTPVVVGAHDIAACSYGCGGMDAGHLALIFGTVGLSLGVMEKPHVSYGLTIESILPRRWLFSACIQGAGAVLNWFLDNLFTHEQWLAAKEGGSVFDRIDEELVKRAPPALLCHPYLFGQNEPAYARAGLYGMAAWHDKYDLLLSVYQGIVFAFLKENHQLLENNPIHEVWLVGGGSRSRVFGQIFADVLGKKIYIPSFEEATSRGVALCALIQIGAVRVSDGTVPRNLDTRVLYEPDMERHVWYQTQYQAFLEYEQKLLPLWREQHRTEQERK